MGKKLYAYLTILLACTSFVSVQAQTRTNNTHWMFSRSNFNPGATGANKGVELMLWGREQWVGLSGHPSTQMFTGYGYIDKAKSAIGGTVMYDRIGIQSNLHVRVNYAYHITLSEKTFLSVGVGGGFMYYNTDVNSLDLQNPNDPLLSNFQENKILPDVAAGVELVHKNFIVGASAGQLIGAPTTAYPSYARGINVYGNYSFNIKNKARIVPGILVRSPLYTIQFEGNLMGYFMQDRIWIGASYRYQDAISGMAGVMIAKRVKIGYAYDHTLSRLRPYNSGTHEVMLMYSFKKERKKKSVLNNPRTY